MTEDLAAGDELARAGAYARAYEALKKDTAVSMLSENALHAIAADVADHVFLEIRKPEEAFNALRSRFLRTTMSVFGQDLRSHVAVIIANAWFPSRRRGGS